jgi:hypothetical protein
MTISKGECVEVFDTSTHSDVEDVEDVEEVDTEYLQATSN